MIQSRCTRRYKGRKVYSAVPNSCNIVHVSHDIYCLLTSPRNLVTKIMLLTYIRQIDLIFLPHSQTGKRQTARDTSDLIHRSDKRGVGTGRLSLHHTHPTRLRVAPARPECQSNPEIETCLANLEGGASLWIHTAHRCVR